MKLLTRILLLTIIDFLLIWLWVYYVDPDPSVSIALIIVVPVIIGLNLLIALILHLRKRRFASLFIINSLISAVLMYFIFIEGVNRHQRRRLDSWQFQLADTTFTITHWKADKTFDLTYSTSPGLSVGFLYGQFISKGSESHLTTDSTDYIIRNGYIFGFRKDEDSIRLTKIER